MWATLFPALMKMIGSGSAMGGAAGGASKAAPWLAQTSGLGAGEAAKPQGGTTGGAGGNLMSQIMGMLGKGGGGGRVSGGGGGGQARPSAAPVVQAGMAEAFKRGLSAQNLLTQITSKDTYVDDLLRERMRSRVR